MAYHQNTNVAQYQWRDKILKIRQHKKDKLISEKNARELALKIEEEYNHDLIPPTTDILNAYLQLCHSKEQTETILKKFSDFGIKPDTTTYNIRISHAEYLSEAKELYDSMIRKGLLPNTYTLNGFMPFCKTIAEGREII